MTKYIAVLVGMLPLVCLGSYARAQIKAQVQDLSSPNDNVVTLYATKNKGLWVGTTTGLSRSGPADEYIKLKSATRDWYVAGIVTDARDNVWVATADGVYKLTEDGRLKAKILVGVPTSAIAIDKKNGIWVGTLNRGLLKVVSDALALAIRRDDGLPSDTVLSILPQGNTDIWAGTDQGLGWYNGTQWLSVPVVRDRSVFSLKERLGTIFAGTDDGAYAGTGPESTWSKLPGSQGKVVTSLAFINEDLVVGTRDSGLLVYKQGALSALPVQIDIKKFGFSSTQVSSIADRGDGSFVIGTFGGGAKELSWDILRK